MVSVGASVCYAKDRHTKRTGYGENGLWYRVRMHPQSVKISPLILG